MSDTPETDAMWRLSGYACDPADPLYATCSDLERRLADADKLLETVRVAMGTSSVMEGLNVIDTLTERLQAALREVEEHKRDAERWRWSKDILSGEDDADAKTALVAAGLMRNETINSIVDAALAEKGKP